MPLQTINIGASANDGTGDPLCTAFDKVNDNSLSNSSGSTYAVTLAAPTSAEDGIVKAIKMIAGDGTNTVTLALTNVVGGSAATTATFDSAGQILILQAAGGKWVVIKEFGVTLT